MGGYGLPALDVRPPQQVDTLGNLQKLMALKNEGLQQQSMQQEIQMRQAALAAQQQIAQIAPQHVKKDDQGRPTGYDYDGLISDATSKGVPPQFLNPIVEMRQKAAATAKDQSEADKNYRSNQESLNKTAFEQMEALKGIQDPQQRQQAWMSTLQWAQQNHVDGADKLPQQAPDNNGLAMYEIPLGMHAQALADAEKQAGQFKEVGGQLVNVLTGETKGPQIPVDQINKGFNQRWQVLHPGENAPAFFQLPPNATNADFQRIDKQLEQTEKAEGTKAQQDQTNAIRQETLTLAKAAAEQRETKQGEKWVSWTDPSGKEVAGPLAMAQAQGAQYPAEVPTEQVRNIQDARGVVNLLNKQGQPVIDQNGKVRDASKMGINQLIDSLEKDGKLGIAASRINSFLAGKVGTSPEDDPRTIALMNKMNLMMTLSMKAHFGASGGRSPQMLQHFLDMANATKMDANTLRAGANAVGDYMEDRAMMPGQQSRQSASPAPQGGGVTVTDPRGGVHTFKDQASADKFKKLAGIQ